METTQKELEKYFNFSEADLSANRNGLLSPAQNARLMLTTRNLSLAFVLTLSLLGGVILALVASLFILPLWFIVGKFVNWENILWAIPCSLPIFLFIYLYSRILKNIDNSIFALKTTVGEIRVKQAEEEVEIHTKSGKTEFEIETRCEIHVGDIRFITTDSKLQNLIKKEEGEVYAVYYLSSETDSKTKEFEANDIRSLEKLSKEDE